MDFWVIGTIVGILAFCGYALWRVYDDEVKQYTKDLERQRYNEEPTKADKYTQLLGSTKACWSGSVTVQYKDREFTVSRFNPGTSYFASFAPFVPSVPVSSPRKTKLPRCRYCGTLVDVGARLCDRCGGPLWQNHIEYNGGTR